ncbi:hypothetical protein [Sphingobium sp. WCS2017Hpa-17]|uniref:hypothetical protein n=1 Tax=Sphingobium sp. WCS2017Hpa-17 TaxID=3073638 RepID=UPI00288C03A9|nr:hypothetical protein [Sphingobium sp. WCS2017Hpa-17]
MKRWRTPTAKPGQIKIVYGRVDRHNNPDLCVAWGAGTDMKCTARLIMHAITEKTLHAKFPGPGHEYHPSLVEELETRGFDITTLRITIEKKDAAHD